MNKPDISVIVPLYNKEQIIERTVKSVLNQSFTNFELIIVNDGSTDNSFEIVKNIQDKRIVLIEQSNGGPSKARNTGVKAAKGDWIIFLDADDELLSDAMENFMKLARQHPDIDIFDCGRYINKNGILSIVPHSDEGLVKNNFKAWFFRDIAPGAGPTMFKRTFVTKYPYDERIRRFEDGEILFRMFKKAKIFTSNIMVEVHNVDYCAASYARNDIKEDFAGYLYFSGLPFWGRMCMYRIFIGERDYYTTEMRKLYPTWYYRYDLLLLFKILNYFK